MTDQDVLTLLQYALIEPPDAGATWPSGLWTRDEVIAALNTRMRQYLRDTQAIATYIDIAVLANANPITLPAGWIATLAANWRTSGGVRSPLTPSDMFEIDLAIPTWETTTGTPLVILDGDGGTLTCRLGPVPSANGTLELLYMALPTAANGSGVTLSIPDEALDGIRYGALEDLLSKVGRGADPLRAQYCHERFEMGELLTEMILGGWA